MSMKCINICFIIILVSTSLFSVATAVDGYVFEPSAAFFHRLLLTDDTSKTDEFSFTFSKDSNCEKQLKISFGSAKSGSSLISFNIDTSNVAGEGVVSAKIFSMNDPSSITVWGDKFVATFKSLGPIKLQGKQDGQSSPTNITEAFSFDKFNSTHLGITFYAWSADANACPFHFDFPEYEVLKGKTFLPPTTKVLPPYEIPPLQPTTTSPSSNTASTGKADTTDTGNSSTGIYIGIGVATFLMGLIISAVTSYFVLSRFSYFKPPEDDNTKIDAEETKTKATIYKNSSNQEEVAPSKTVTKVEKTATAKTTNLQTTKAGNNTTKQQTLNGIPNIDSYDGRKDGNA